VRAAAITLAVALAALAIGTANARAADRAEVGAMIDVATTHFGDHCVAGITVAWVVPGGLDGADVPGGHGIGRGAGCRIWLDTGYYDSASWGEACALVVHEAGHALGHGHSSNPASVMQSPAPARFAPCERASPQVALERKLVRIERRCEGRSARANRLRGRRGGRAWRRYNACMRKYRRVSESYFEVLGLTPARA
jgi:hypothetical protein